MLAHPQVLEKIAPFTIVRLNPDSTDAMVDVDGTKLTPKALAEKYEMIYRPGVLAFDKNNLSRRNRCKQTWAL